MAARVGENLDRMQQVLATGDRDAAAAASAADDAIDAMAVSLTERCHDLICREAPVASDLRLLLSVLRVLEALERIGDLTLRVTGRAGDHSVVAEHPAILTILREMASLAVQHYDLAVEAWATQDLDLARELESGGRRIEVHHGALMSQLLSRNGPESTRVAVATVVIGRALDRIVDHTVIVGDRLQFLLTGDSAHLAAEMR